MSLIRSNKSCIGWGLEKIERDASILSWRNQAVTLIDGGHERGFERYGDLSPAETIAGGFGLLPVDRQSGGQHLL
jgi:hypothetical protein